MPTALFGTRAGRQLRQRQLAELKRRNIPEANHHRTPRSRRYAAITFPSGVTKRPRPRRAFWVYSNACGKAVCQWRIQNFNRGKSSVRKSLPRFHEQASVRLARTSALQVQRVEGVHCFLEFTKLDASVHVQNSHGPVSRICRRRPCRPSSIQPVKTTLDRATAIRCLIGCSRQQVCRGIAGQLQRQSLWERPQRKDPAETRSVLRVVWKTSSTFS